MYFSWIQCLIRFFAMMFLPKPTADLAGQRLSAHNSLINTGVRQDAPAWNVTRLRNATCLCTSSWVSFIRPRGSSEWNSWYDVYWRHKLVSRAQRMPAATTRPTSTAWNQAFVLQIFFWGLSSMKIYTCRTRLVLCVKPIIHGKSLGRSRSVPCLWTEET